MHKFSVKAFFVLFTNFVPPSLKCWHAINMRLRNLALNLSRFRRAERQKQCRADAQSSCKLFKDGLRVGENAPLKLGEVAMIDASQVP